MHPTRAEDLEFDEGNESHLARHRITLSEVSEIWCSDPLYVPNRKGLASVWLMLGDTAAGRKLTIAVLVDEVRLRLRPITGWDSTPNELSKWRSGKRE